MDELESNTDLPKLIEEFGSEAKCRAFLEALRWPEGIYCPRCHEKKVSRIASRDQFDCDSCRYQFSATAGTVFHDSHLPLWKWFLAVYMLCESKKGVSANQLKRMLGVSYKTAWYLCHRIRQAMTVGLKVEGKLRKGVVEMDDTRIGGEAQKWRPIPQKTYVVGMVERDGRLRFQVVSDLSSKTLSITARKHVSKDIELIITDEWAAYVNAIGPYYTGKLRRIKHKRQYVDGTIHTNSIENAFSLLKRGITGSWHHVSAKHLQRYLDEMSFRFSERKNPRLFSDTLTELVNTNPLTFKALTRKRAA
jgi:transposase-like protein